tara:strand:- start:45 stop:290 length:246 start_codon:yes stop_codon:yes gene_type:complete
MIEVPEVEGDEDNIIIRGVVTTTQEVDTIIEGVNKTPEVDIIIIIMEMVISKISLKELRQEQHLTKLITRLFSADILSCVS